MIATQITLHILKTLQVGMLCLYDGASQSPSLHRTRPDVLHSLLDTILLTLNLGLCHRSWPILSADKLALLSHVAGNISIGLLLISTA